MANSGSPDVAEGSRIHIERPVLNQVTYEALYPNTPKDDRVEGAFCAKQRCGRECLLRRVQQHIPCLGIMKDYNPKRQLLADIIAGIIVAIVAIPQGMAYAMLAAVPAVFGLYGCFLPPLIYFIFGTSRHISIGTFALASVIIGNFVASYDCSMDGQPVPPSANISDTSTSSGTVAVELFSGSGFTQEELCQVNLALSISLMAGVIQFALGLLQVGFVSTYMSYPQTRAFTSASSVIVLLGQIQGLLQLDLPKRSGPLSVFYVLSDVALNIQHTNWYAAVLSIASIVILLISKKCIEPRFKKKFKVPIPVELLLVVLMTCASYFGKINESQGVKILGDVPTGFPTPAIPPLASYNWLELLPTAVSAAIVGYANAISYGKMVARQKGYEVNGNQELFAHGLINVFGSMFNAILSSATLSRSSIAVSAGATTQVFGVVASALMLLVILFLGFVFNHLPNCILSSIIVVALHRLILQITDLKSLWRIDKVDFFTWLLTFLFTLILDVSLGLYTSLIVVVLTLIYHSQTPKSSVRGHLSGTEIYLDVSKHSEVTTFEGVVIFRFDSALHFANVETFMQHLQSKTNVSLRQLRTRKEGVKVSDTNGTDAEMKASDDLILHSLVLDCSALSYVDSVGASTLIEVVKEYHQCDLTICLAACNERVQRTLIESGFLKAGSLHCFYHTVHDAVTASLDRNVTGF